MIINRLMLERVPLLPKNMQLLSQYWSRMLSREALNRETMLQDDDCSMNECSQEIEENVNLKCPLVNKIAEYVFSQEVAFDNQSTVHDLPFKVIWNNVCKHLQKKVHGHEASWCSRGRLGSNRVKFTSNKRVGSFEYKDDGLEICSKENFSTICANTFVYKGKWQYEALLGSKGVMQIGWATVDCDFSQEHGVGDTRDSYAYDGNRQRKWNVTTEKYGEFWNAGDVISCTVDLDEGKIGYYKNGVYLGTAFDKVKIGPGFAYCPALSLASDQSLLVNFGETPFWFPQLGFQPLQSPPYHDIVIAETAIGWLQRLVDLAIRWKECKELVNIEESNKESRDVALILCASRISRLLNPLLCKAYVVESILLPLLRSFTVDVGKGASESHLDEKRAKKFLCFLLVAIEDEDKKKVLDVVMMCLQKSMSRISPNIDYSAQKSCLKILHLLFSEYSIRKLCLERILFEKSTFYRIVSFTSFQCFDMAGFKELSNIDFWCTKDGKNYHGNKEEFVKTAQSLQRASESLMALQLSVLEVLMTADDSLNYNGTSRATFLAKFRTFIKERLVSSRLLSTPFVSSNAVLWFFRCGFMLFERLWEREIDEPLGEATIPASLFFDGHLDYFDTQRLGGLESHLRKRFAAERQQALCEEEPMNQLLSPLHCDRHSSSDVTRIAASLPSTSGAVLGEILPTEMESVKEGLQRFNVTGSEESKTPRTKQELRSSLLHFFDGIVLIYHCKGHKQIDKVVAQTDAFYDNVEYLKELQKKKEKYLNSENVSQNVAKELDRSVGVIESNLRDQSYMHVWNVAHTYSVENVRKIIQFTKLVIGALKNSSKKSGLFSFVPDFYVEVLSELSRDLRSLVLPEEEAENEEKLKLYLPGGTELPNAVAEEFWDLFKVIAEFLALHFSDSRVVFADSKDLLIQSLAKFVCHKTGLKALENMSKENRFTMVKSLLQPYENRAWAQNNWILVRFWKGNGYAFRFTRSPHLEHKLGPKPAHCELPNIILSSAPFASEVFLQMVSEVLSKSEISTPFVNSLLNQLNWVFSEFIGMLQEIQNASNRPERVFIDSRQLRICATCFDLTLALLRVLEMIVSRAPSVFLDCNSLESKPLLMRLCQLVCQVLNRVGVGAGCFSHVVNMEIPGLETIHYFPILTAVAGIVCELIGRDIEHDKAKAQTNSAAQFLLDEASFQLNSLYALVGGKSALKNLPENRRAKSPCSEGAEGDSSPFVTQDCECKDLKFCFRNYPSDICPDELSKLVAVLDRLEETSLGSRDQTMEDDQDPETACTICYANASDAVFAPCGHSSCSTCITHYLMNKSVCFFCKSTINRVTDNSGKVIFTAEENATPS